jgi:hypothetical protein
MSKREIECGGKKRNTAKARHVWASGRHSRRPCLILWECIDDLIPGSFGTHENVFAWTYTRITIDGCQYHFGDLSGIAKNKRAAALPAKASLFSR